MVITGDKHQNSVRNVAEHYTHWWQEPWIATEFVGTSISSDGDDSRAPFPTDGGAPDNPQILLDDFHRGYVRVELDRETETWRSDFRVVETVRRRENVPAWTLESWIVQHGEPGASLQSGEPSAVQNGEPGASLQSGEPSAVQNGEPGAPLQSGDPSAVV